MLREYDLEHAKGRNKSLITKEGSENMVEGESLEAERARLARRGVAIVNYMARDTPDLPVTARVLLQHMASPRNSV